MIRSSVPAAQKALVNAFRSFDALDDVHVQWGLPATEPRKRERIYVTGTESYIRDQLAEERYRLRVVVEVDSSKPDHTGEPTSERLWEIVDDMAAALAADDELDGAVWNAEVSDVDDDLYATDSGWLCRAKVRILITNRDPGI